jgi:hypothetical protein
MTCWNKKRYSKHIKLTLPWLLWPWPQIHATMPHEVQTYFRDLSSGPIMATQQSGTIDDMQQEEVVVERL